jgi:YesN/AraC family two-component response regulator
MPAEEGFTKAIENFIIASDLDKSLPEYGLSFIGKTFWMDWDFQATYNQLLETLEQHPKYTDGLEAMAELLIAHEQWAKAEVYIRKAMEVDPLSANHFYTLANINYYQKKFEIALTYIEKSLFINPEFVPARELKTLCLIWLGQKNDFEDFVAEHENSAIQTLYYQVINNGKYTLSKEITDSWKKISSDRNLIVPYELFILANTEHRKQALALLREYVQQKRGQIINFRHDPSLEKLQQFDEFNQLHQSNLTLPLSSKIQAKNQPETRTTAIELDGQMQKLMLFFENEKPFLDAQLSLSSLASALLIHPNQLSYLINEKTGVNFNEFINQFRLQHFKEISTKPGNSRLKILGLAYEIGFNSKSVFNSYFKKAEGITPGEWLEQNTNEK